MNDEVHFSSIAVFGIIGFISFMGGIGLLVLGDTLQGLSGVAIGVLFLWRTWGDLRRWAE